MLFLGCINPTQSLNKSSFILFNCIFAIILILFVGFRDGSGMPDYNSYIDDFRTTTNNRSFEITFRFVINLVKSVNLSYIFFFLIYACLSVGLRYIAIIKYSYLTWFTLATWFCFILILHDMIQIRAAVASSIMLFIVPLIYEKKYLKAFFLICIAFCFHRSAIIFMLIFLTTTKRDFWGIWVGAYLLFTTLCILHIDIFKSLNEIGLTSISVMEGDVRRLEAQDSRPNMFAPLTLIQTITCFLIILQIKKVASIYPLAKTWLKVGLMSLIIYGTGIAVVSVRLAELLSTSFIFLIPLLYFVYSGPYRKILGKATVCTFVIAYLTNYIFFREFIPLTD